MANIFYIYKDAVWQDISNWVASDKVPYISMNRDYSPIAESLECKISSRSTYTPAVDDKIKIEIDSVPVYGGTIKKSLYNTKELYYDVKIVNDLTFQDKKAATDVLGTLIANTGGDLFKHNPLESEAYPYANINILWLLQCFFSSCGMTLDISDVESEIALKDFYSSGVDLLYKHLIFDYAAFWCINQNVACGYTQINADYKNNILTIKEIFDEIMGCLGFGINLTAADSYKLFKPTGNYSIAANIRREYKSENIKAEADPVDGYSLQITGAWENNDITFGPLFNRKFYYTAAIHYLPYPPLISIGYGKKKLTSYSNMIFLTYTYDSQNEEVLPVTSNVQYILYSLSVYNPYTNKILAATNDYVREEFITLGIQTTPKTVLKNFIDMKTSESEIIQETYL